MSEFDPIIQFPNYSISREGVIKNPYGKIMKLQMVQGYKMLIIQKKRVSIHRLLGLQFIPNPENKPVIDHIDRNRLNNNIENLRWATIKENSNNRDNIRTDEYWREYKKKKQAGYRSNMSEEKHQEVLDKKKERYDNEKQKEYVTLPQVKEKRLADQQRKRQAVKLFNILPFAAP
jgi:hypothetical protein